MGPMHLRQRRSPGGAGEFILICMVWTWLTDACFFCLQLTAAAAAGTRVAEKGTRGGERTRRGGCAFRGGACTGGVGRARGR